VTLQAAHDYDPFGTDHEEHPTEALAAIDADPASTWSTETYQNGFPGGKKGVGIYVDAGQQIAARRVDVRTPTPGFDVQVYGSNRATFDDPQPDSFANWGRPLAAKTVDAKRSISINTQGRTLRYYLIWIVKLPAGGKAEIATLRVLR
jgi:hypothetical protein